MEDQPKKPKKGDAPYNQHMKRTIKKLKEENPGIHHRDAFCQAAELWKTSPENPKNKKNSGAGSSSKTKDEDEDEPEEEQEEEEEEETEEQ